MTTYTYVFAAGIGASALWTNPARWEVGTVETGGIPGAGDTAIVGSVTLESETLTDITLEGVIALDDATLDSSVLLTGFGSEGGGMQLYGEDLFAGTFDAGVAGQQSLGAAQIGFNAANSTLVNTGFIDVTQNNVLVVSAGSFADTFVNMGTYEFTWGGNDFGQGIGEELSGGGVTGGLFVNDGTFIINGTGAPNIAYAQGEFYDTVNGTGTIEVTHGLLIIAGVADGQTIDFEDGTSRMDLSYTDFTTTPVLGQIVGFRPGDFIQLNTTVTSADPSTPGVVELFDGTTPVGSLNITPAPGETIFTITQLQGYGSELGMKAACYAAGTRLATPGGEAAVQDLHTGDLVLTASGASRPVVWIGERHVECRRHPRPQEVWPVRVRAGAFGEGVPQRDLILSPDHGVFVAGWLIPVRCLIDDITILQEPVARVHYFHVELECHDLLLAEGLPAESFLDTGNRAAFANGGGVVMAHPDFARRVWDAESCAPLLLSGPALAKVQARLIARAAAGHGATRRRA